MAAVTKTRIKPEAEYPVSFTQPFYTLKQAWIIKGCCCAWNTFEQNNYFQPKGGFPDGTIGGVRVFDNKTILEWLYLTDQQMEAYHRKYKTGASAKNTIKKIKRLEASA